MITPEQICNEYHKQTFYHSKGFYPKAIKDYDKQKSKPDWVYFEKFSRMINDNVGMVDYKIYIEALTDFYDGHFPPKMLTHPKSIKIYKSFVELKNCSDDKTVIEEGVLTSIKFVVNYCREKNITDFNDYLFENCELIPTPLKHYRAGSLSKHFMALIPGILFILQQYPSDVVRDYMRQFKDDYDSIRSKVIHIEKLRKIGDNLSKIIDNLIKKEEK